jgi:hypothetical protein
MNGEAGLKGPIPEMHIKDAKSLKEAVGKTAPLYTNLKFYLLLS